jgi:hypothetical protein
MKTNGRFNMDRSKLKRLGFLLVIAAGISVLPIRGARAADNIKIRWDIPSVDFSTHPVTLSPGGHSSAIANDGTSITLTGTGTFSSNSGKPQNVTGGGTWETFAEDGVTATGSGTYQVTGFVSFVLAPAPFPPTPAPIDNVCSDCMLHSGLAVLGIAYSDGGEGVLVISCNVPGEGTPESVFEGITVSKDFIDYWNRHNPVPGVDGNRTLIHILQ